MFLLITLENENHALSFCLVLFWHEHHMFRLTGLILSKLCCSLPWVQVKCMGLFLAQVGRDRKSKPTSVGMHQTIGIYSVIDNR